MKRLSRLIVAAVAVYGFVFAMPTPDVTSATTSPVGAVIATAVAPSWTANSCRAGETSITFGGFAVDSACGDGAAGLLVPVTTAALITVAFGILVFALGGSGPIFGWRNSFSRLSALCRRWLTLSARNLQVLQRDALTSTPTHEAFIGPRDAGRRRFSVLWLYSALGAVARGRFRYVETLTPLSG
jgi:hypothetical protein